MRHAAAALIAAALLALAQDVATADANPELDQLMGLLAQRRHGEADFSETKYLSLLRQPLKSSGVLIYEAPDHLEQRTEAPKPQSVVLDHGMLTLQIGKRQRVLRLADYPQLAPLIDSIRATLAGDRAALERVFQIGFDGSLPTNATRERDTRADNRTSFKRSGSAYTRRLAETSERTWLFSTVRSSPTSES